MQIPDLKVLHTLTGFLNYAYKLVATDEPWFTFEMPTVVVKVRALVCQLDLL